MAKPFNSVPTALETWLSELRATKRSEATISAYGYAAGQLSEFLGAENEDRLLTVAKREATAFATWLNDNYKVGGNRSRIRSVRVFFNWAIAEGEYKEANPFAKLMPKEEEHSLPTPSDDDIEAILATFKGRSPHRDRAVILMLADTGCRKPVVGH